MFEDCEFQFLLRMKNLYFFLPFILSLCSCSDESPLDQVHPYFEEFRDCESMPIREDSLIGESLPGRWELVALHAALSGSTERPNMVLEFDEDLNLRFTYEDSTWTYQMAVKNRQLLRADSLKRVSFVSSIDVFCENLMGYDDTPLDGARYIFEKR